MERNYPLRTAAVARRVAIWLFSAFAVVVLAYFGAALIGALVPANPRWTPPADGIRIFVEDNGVHTGIVVPAVAAGVDWRATVPARDIADPRHAAQGWIAFGWGDAAFYRNTPRWADLRPGTVIGALVGGGATVLHVEHIAAPQSSASVRSIVLRPDEYRRLATRIRATFADGAPVTMAGYGAHDVFYAARGRYDALRTCNAWTGSVLRDAGVRMGKWTPVPWAVMRWLD